MSDLSDLAALLNGQASGGQRRYTAADVNRRPLQYPQTQPAPSSAATVSSNYDSTLTPGDEGFDWSMYHQWRANQLGGDRPEVFAKPLVNKFNAEGYAAGQTAAAGEQSRLTDIATHPVREMGRELGHATITGELPLAIGGAMLAIPGVAGAASAAKNALTAGRAAMAGGAATGIGRLVTSPIASELAEYIPGRTGHVVRSAMRVGQMVGRNGATPNSGTSVPDSGSYGRAWQPRMSSEVPYRMDKYGKQPPLTTAPSEAFQPVSDELPHPNLGTPFADPAYGSAALDALRRLRGK